LELKREFSRAVDQGGRNAVIDQKQNTGTGRPATVLVRLLEKCTDWISFLWIQAGLLLLILVVLNALAGVASRAINHFSKGPRLEQAYDNAPWAVKYFKTLNHHEVRWFPYSYWKSVPVSTPGLNVDARGDRITINSPLDKNHPPSKIFMFGGSTMWGTGVRDDATLPSIVARRLTAAGLDVEVSNYGQIGYVSTQEVLLLYQLLRDGERPDLVVFYDGINDGYAAYQSRIAGLSQNEFARVKEFDLLVSAHRRSELYIGAASSILMHSYIARLGRILDRRPVNALQAGPPKVVAYLAPADYEQPALLRQQVISDYLFNKRVVELLGKEFGFRTIFYWQPMIYNKNKLSTYEFGQLGDAERRDFMMGIYKLMAEDKPHGVNDISGIFRDHEGLIFIDTWHPNEVGDQIIANRMAEDIVREIKLTHNRAESQNNTAAAAGSAATASPPRPERGNGAPR
jgi:lysophospholipase L1-like esterase